MTVKYEKVTLWTAVDVYDETNSISASDYITTKIDDYSSLKIIDIDAEELVLTPKPQTPLAYE